MAKIKILKKTCKKMKEAISSGAGYMSSFSPLTSLCWYTSHISMVGLTPKNYLNTFLKLTFDSLL